MNVCPVCGGINLRKMDKKDVFTCIYCDAVLKIKLIGYRGLDDED